MSLTSERPIEAKAPAYTPEFFRLPRTTERDPFFGNTRSQYYAWDREGLIALVHLRQRGRTRGTTYVCYAQVADLIRRAQGGGEF